MITRFGSRLQVGAEKSVISFHQPRSFVKEKVFGMEPFPTLDVESWASKLCGEEELVRQVHTLFGRSAQVLYELQVQEKVEGVRQEVRESKKGEQGEEKRSHEHGHVDGMKDSLLEPRCVCA